MSDAKTISAIKARQRIGAEALYDRYAGLLLKVLYIHLKNQQSAEEALEPLFVLIWNSIDQYENKEGRFVLWLVSLARKVAKMKGMPENRNR